MKRLPLLLLAILVPALAFATGTSETTSNSTEPVEIRIKAMGDPPDGLPAMLAELNQRTLEDLNATVRIDHYGWSDWKNKYRLDLVSGEPIDMLYSASWAGYAQYADDGAFTDISDMLPEVAPVLYSEIPAEQWSAVTAPGGAIYAVPSRDRRPLVEGAIYREDLRKKYNLEPITDLESIEALLAAVHENEPDMRALGNAILRRNGWFSMRPYHRSFQSHLFINYENPEEGFTTHLDMRERIIEHASRIRSWYDAGYFSQDVLANLDSPRVADRDFENGITPITKRNHEYYSGQRATLEAENPGWEIGFLPGAAHEHGLRASYKAVFQDATVFPVAGDDTAAALQFTELALTDESYHSLLYYGVEGVHHEKPTPDTIKVPTDTEYSPNALGLWGVMNSDFVYTAVGDPSEQYLQEVLAQVDTIYPDYSRNFLVYDISPVEPTLAALSVVHDEMFVPLMVGLYAIDDIPDQVDAYLAALEEAGVEELVEFFTPFWEDFLDQ